MPRPLLRAARLMALLILAPVAVVAVGAPVVLGAAAEAATPADATAPGVTTPAAAEVGAGPHEVVIGVSINSIQQIDIEAHTYTVDFQLWARWTDPALRPLASIDFMNDTDQWGTTIDLATEEPIRLPDGSWYQREHVQSRFTSNLTVEDYPFDDQTLLVVMEDRQQGVDDLVFVPGDPAAEKSASLSVPGYQVGTPSLDVVEVERPELGAIGTGSQTVSRVVVSIPIVRPWVPYALKIFVPFLVVVICTALVFLIGPDHVDARFGLGISALLTLVALKWTTDAEIPLIDFVGLVDWLYLLAFVFVGVSLVSTTYDTWRRSRGDDDMAIHRTDIRVLVVAATVFVVGCALVFLSLGF